MVQGSPEKAGDLGTDTPRPSSPKWKASRGRPRGSLSKKPVSADKKPTSIGKKPDSSNKASADIKLTPSQDSGPLAWTHPEKENQKPSSEMKVFERKSGKHSKDKYQSGGSTGAESRENRSTIGLQ